MEKDVDDLRKCFLTADNTEAISIVELNLMLLYNGCQIIYFNFLSVVISVIFQKAIFLECLFKGLQKAATNTCNINGHKFHNYSKFFFIVVLCGYAESSLGH